MSPMSERDLGIKNFHLATICAEKPPQKSSASDFVLHAT
jgi:hypothetical protein